MPSDATGPIEYLRMLSDRDRVRVRYSHRRGVPDEIMAQLECWIDGRWRPVRRYDTHMGLHVHTAPWDAELDRLVQIGDLDLKSALTLAIADMRANWEAYRAACEAGRRSE